jgi:hypothetical protein
MHLDDEQLQRLLHGELGGDGPPVSEHLITCAECRSALAEGEQDERWVLDRLRELDHAQPLVSADPLIATTHGRVPAWRRLAAGIVLVLAATGVAYAAPGSPLPRLLERLVGVLRAPGEARLAPLPPVQAVASPAGIAVEPGSRLTIVFGGDQPAGIAIVSLSDSSEVIIRTVGGTNTFTSDINQVTIEHSGPPATTDILIPRHASLVEVHAGGRTIFLKKGSSVVTVARPDPEGRYRLPLGAGGP